MHAAEITELDWQALDRPARPPRPRRARPSPSTSRSPRTSTPGPPRRRRRLVTAQPAAAGRAAAQRREAAPARRPGARGRGAARRARARGPSPLRDRLLRRPAPLRDLPARMARRPRRRPDRHSRPRPPLQERGRHASAAHRSPTTSAQVLAEPPGSARAARARARSSTAPSCRARSPGRVEKAWDAAGLNRITLHECRHTYASLLMAAGYTIKELMEFMGHADLQMVNRYVKLLPQPGEDDAPTASTPTSAAPNGRPGDRSIHGRRCCSRCGRGPLRQVLHAVDSDGSDNRNTGRVLLPRPEQRPRGRLVGDGD